MWYKGLSSFYLTDIPLYLHHPLQRWTFPHWTVSVPLTTGTRAHLCPFTLHASLRAYSILLHCCRFKRRLQIRQCKSAASVLLQNWGSPARATAVRYTFKTPTGSFYKNPPVILAGIVLQINVGETSSLKFEQFKAWTRYIPVFV